MVMSWNHAVNILSGLDYKTEINTEKPTFGLVAKNLIPKDWKTTPRNPLQLVPHPR